MNKKGSMVIFLIVIIVVVALAVFIFLPDDSKDEIIQNTTINNFTDCELYTDKIQCSQNSLLFLNISSLNWGQNDCNSKDVDCSCKWNEILDTCEFSIKNFTSLINDFIDLTAYELELVNHMCSPSNVTTPLNCSMGINATLRNIGSKSTVDPINVHLVDITSLNEKLVHRFTITDSLNADEQLHLFFQYTNISKGDYIVEFRVDPNNYIEEKFENNNQKIGRVTLTYRESDYP